MAIPVNPYIAGNSVGDTSAFVGRADVLREVLHVLRRPQDNAIVLYGQRRIGKTSILQHLAAWLSRRGPYRPVHFDLQDKAAWPLSRVLQELAHMIAYALGQPTPDLGPDPENSFRHKWLPAVVNDLSEGCSLVLLFDEFDVLAGPKAEQAAAAFFPYLRELLTSDPKHLKFIFVIGRNVDDLDNIVLSLFKGMLALRVSLLSHEDTTNLVRLSQINGTLRWSDETTEHIWQLTSGHPFLTQQLCSRVWERAYERKSHRLPSVTSQDVDAVISDTLETSRNTLEWLWDGLPPAERVVASALAEAGPAPITQEKLEQLLHESGVRVVIRELQNAPQLLQDWDLIEPADGGYRFRVELLRRWIIEHKPLRRVREELDRIEPVADSLYRAALGLYQGGQLEQAIAPLRQAVALNPNHIGANQLLADILLAQAQPGEARQLLERLYEYQPAAARSRLVQAFLALAHVADSADQRLAFYEHVLSKLDATQPEAITEKRRIWRERGDAAVKRDDLEAARRAYWEAGLIEKEAEVEREICQRNLAIQLQELEALEQEGIYRNALDIARRLADEYPEARDWAPDLERLERKIHLADLYQRALEALRNSDQQTAQILFAQVVALEPGYEEATRYLHIVVTGVDTAELQDQLRAREEDCYRLEQKLRELQAKLDREEEHGQHAKVIRERKEASGKFMRFGRSAGQDSEVTTEDKNVLDRLRQIWKRLEHPVGAFQVALVEAFERKAGDWLVSTLTWLPILIPTLALWLIPLPRTGHIFSPTVYFRFSLGLALAWVLTGWLGKRDGKVATNLMTVGAFVVALSVGGVVMSSWAIGMTKDVAVEVTLVIVVGVAFSVASGAMRSVARSVAGNVTAGVASGVSSAMASIVVFVVTAALASTAASVAVDSVALVVADSMLGMIVCLVIGILAFALVGVLVFGIVTRIAIGVATGVAESLAGALVISLLAHVFLIWISFLRGGQVCQGILTAIQSFRDIR